MLDQVAELIREVAATVVLPRFQHLAADEVHQKSPGDLVTVADQESERELTRGLTALLPGSTVVGEEAVAADAGVLDRMNGSGPIWIVDPVDGTNNFAAGKEPFAMMVALVDGGEAVASWILDVPGDHLTLAELGSGTYRDGVRVKSRTDDPGVAAMTGVVASHYFPAGLHDEAKSNAHLFGEITRGRHCAGWEYPAVATGGQQFAAFWKVLPWDHVPGALIIREAGGTVRHFDGSDYHPASRESGLLAAENAEIWRSVRDALLPSFISPGTRS